MNIVTETKQRKRTDRQARRDGKTVALAPAAPQAKVRICRRLATAKTQARNTCIAIQQICDEAGGLEAVQALFDPADADDLITAFNATRTYALTLDSTLDIPELT